MKGGAWTTAFLKQMLLALLVLTSSFMIQLAFCSPCKQYFENCEKCVATRPDCAWCAAPSAEFSDEKNQTLSRCDQYKSLVLKCPSKHLIYHRSSVETIEELRSEQSKIQSPILIYPKKIVAKLRPGDPVSFNVTFKQIADYPVDIYFLLDLSNSMVDDKNRLSQLVEQLANEMKNITKDFKLGFGSFVEKPIMPFVSPPDSDISMQKSCSLQEIDQSNVSCIPAYSFKHHLSLTHDFKMLGSQIDKAHVSRNIDEPEGGLDALMQVIVCEDIIGWRPNSRRLVVFYTDAGLHFAGDGKLAGIIQPNDEKCHLTRIYDKHFERYVYDYTESLNQNNNSIYDYPSFGQIYAQMMEHNVNVIFAVTNRQVPLYTEIANFLEAAVVGEVSHDDDSTNIVDLVAKNYKKITNRMRLMVTTSTETVVKEGKMFKIGDNLKILLEPECRTARNIRHGGEEDSRCEIGLGEEITVSMNVEADKCIEHKNITLFPYGMKNDALTIEIIPKCKCLCEWDNRKGKCNGRGTYSCGICSCRSGFHGRDCECAGDNDLSHHSSIQKCQRPGSKVICSGRGQCHCGKCSCFRREAGESISGEYCECDNFSCPRWNGKICSGHGKCECDGTCTCDSGWTGDDCSCTSRLESCYANSSGLICNGKGSCECGKCQCDPSEDFLGNTCEECPTCDRGCAESKECVMCMAFQSGSFMDRCSECPYQFEMVDELPNSTGGRRVCQFLDQDGCTFFYSFTSSANDGRMSLQIKRNKSCPLPLPFWLVSTVITTSILIVGVLALVTWRVTVTIQDRNELVAFDKDSTHDKTKWQQGNNPIYRQASISYGNPLYRGNKLNNNNNHAES